MVARRKGLERGSLLIEVTVATALLIGLSLVLMKYIMSIMQVDNWTIVQTLSEAALTYETSYMERIPFEDVLDPINSPFPVYPSYSAANTVTLGTLSAGNTITGTVKRMRQLVGNTNGSTDLESWNLYSVLEYQANGQDYYKVRSVVRTR